MLNHTYIEMPNYMDLQKKVPNYFAIQKEHDRIKKLNINGFTEIMLSSSEGCFPGTPVLQPQGDGSYMIVFSGNVLAKIKSIKGTSRYFVAIYQPMTGGPFQYLASSKEAAKDLTEAQEIAQELYDNEVERTQNKTPPKITIEQATAILSNYIFGVKGIHGMGSIYKQGQEPYIEIQVLEPEGFDFVKNLIPTSRFMDFPIKSEITNQPTILPSTSYISGGQSESAIAEGRRTQRMTLTGFAIIGIIFIIALP